MITDTDLIHSKPRFLQRPGIYLYRDEAKVEKICKKKTFLVIFRAFDCISAVFLNLGMENNSNSNPLK